MNLKKMWCTHLFLLFPGLHEWVNSVLTEIISMREGYFKLNKSLEKNIIIIIIVTPWKFFTSALADGLPLKFEWQ